MHNAIGFDWDPATGRMWAGDTGQDGLGDGVPPEEINLIEAGKHYGFPFFVGRNEAEPRRRVEGRASPTSPPTRRCRPRSRCRRT